MTTRDEVLEKIYEAAGLQTSSVRRGEVLIFEASPNRRGLNWTTEIVDLLPDDPDYSADRSSILARAIKKMRVEHPMIDWELLRSCSPGRDEVARQHCYLAE